ncbi:MAG: DUF362 domain-containing protein [candidate division WOR-3 bacterium]
MGTTGVLVRKVTSLEKAVAEALDFLQFDFSGKKVWVKPNLLAPHPPDAGVTTDPEFVRQVVRQLRHRGAAAVWVADNPSVVHKGPLEDFLAPTGIVAASEGAFRNIGESSLLLPLKSRFVNQIPVSAIINEADVILNLPVLKTHGLTIITGAIKNIFGIIPGGHKAYLHTVVASAQEFAELLVDIYQAVPRPMFHIMDGLRGMDGPNGPSGGRVLKLGLLLASRNGVALDAVVTLLAKGKPRAIPTNRIAHERGLGPIDREGIEIVGDYQPIRGFRLPWTGLAAVVTRASVPVYRLLRRTPVLNRKLCIRCEECARNCPARAITMSPFPRVDRRRCIACFCCAEICPTHALTIAGTLCSQWISFTGR